MFSKINYNNMMLQSGAILVALACLLSMASASNGTCVMNATTDQKAQVQLFSTPCVILQMSARLKIGSEYILLQNGTVDANTTSTDCSTDHEQVTIQFPCAHLEFLFKLNKTEGNMRSLEQIAGTFVDTVGHKNMTIDLTQHILDFPEATNYRCTSEQALNITLNNAGVKTSGLLLLSNVKIDAFRQKVNPNSNTFDLTSDHVCNQDSSDWVPIVVFICLVAMIVIVLVAFFVGRRRWSERSSYESV